MSFSSQRNIIFTIFCFFFFLLRSYSTRNSFEDLDLSSQTLNPAITGFQITGDSVNNYLGISVSTAGDIDNDGYDDIIIGAYGKNGNQGAAYVFYGGEESAFLNIDLSITTFNPLTTGFMLTGSAAGDWFGYAVNTAGDINKDGYDDIIIGAPYKNSQQGAAYVIYGGERSSMSNWDFSSASTLSPSSTGFTITGSASSSFGVSVSTAKDINNDGYDDIIIGAETLSGNLGAAYVIYGGEKSAMSDIVLSTTPLNPTSTGFMISGNAVGDAFGHFVSTAGDVNNDEYDDIIVGAPNKNTNQGAAYVIYGGTKSILNNIVVSSTTLIPSSTGFSMTGNAVNDYFGYAVNTAGDLNNDGYDDIIVGAQVKDSSRGAAYVIYGREKSSMSDWDFSSGATLNPSTTGFMLTGAAAGDSFGCPVNTVGDLNKDGFDDIIIGASGKNSGQGAAYVIYGGAKSSMSNIALSLTTLDPASTGLMITGNAAPDQFGVSVSRAGDVNNDGYDDIIVGARGKNSAQGAAYVIYASCSKNCNQCYSDSMCEECKTSNVMHQYECFASCPETTFANSTITCGNCPTRCKHCSSTSLCTECISPFVLYDTQCLSSCPMTMFNSNNVCKNCPSYCSSCTSQDSCQVCFEGYSLKNSLCVFAYDFTQQKVLKAVSSATQGIGSFVSVGSSAFPFSALVSKIVQNTRYLNLTVTSDLAAVYDTWNTDLISWNVPNLMSNLDHFKTSPYLFAQYSLGSPFLVNFWPTLLNIAIGFGTFIICIAIKKLLEHVKYEGWAHSLVRKLVAGSFNFALVQAYACLDDVLFYLVLDAKTNPFNSFFSWTSMTCAVLFLALGCLQVFFNFWTVKKYQSIKTKGIKEIETFNEKNKYWELFYSDFNDEDLWSQSFFALAIIRSALSSLIIAILYDDPLMQASHLVMMDIAILSFLYLKNPFKALRGTLAQYYYEIITLIVHLGAFILALQDTFESSSDIVRNIMSTGILYLNTALISGTIGFMFIEIYKTISEKKRANRLKKRLSVPEDNQETQNLTEVADKINRTIENSHLDLENMESNFHQENSILSEISPSPKIRRQKNQRPVSITIRPQPQARKRSQKRKKPRIPKDIISYP